jgi:hypothetical protein
MSLFVSLCKSDFKFQKYSDVIRKCHDCIGLSVFFLQIFFLIF